MVREAMTNNLSPIVKLTHFEGKLVISSIFINEQTIKGNFILR